MSSSDLAELAGPRVRVLAECGSSNDELRAWAERGAPDGAVVITDRQSAGRGRLGRSWHSPPGCNLYLSWLVRAPFESLALLPLAGALAARETLAGWLPPVLEVSIKWPNDIEVLGFKVAGLLAEAWTGQRGPAAVLGMGINLNSRAGDFPAGLRRPAASLRMLGGRRLPRARCARQLLAGLARWRRVWRERPRRLVAAYADRCGTVGRRVRVTLPGGGALEGTACGLDFNGSLLVETADGRVERVSAGDVVEQLPLAPT